MVLIAFRPQFRRLGRSVIVKNWAEHDLTPSTTPQLMKISSQQQIGARSIRGSPGLFPTPLGIADSVMLCKRPRKFLPGAD